MTDKTATNQPLTFKGDIAVSGAAGKFGHLLVRHLHRTNKVISIDTRPFPRRPKDVYHLQTELRRRNCRNLFRSRTIKTVIHLGPHHTTGKPGSSGFTAAIENFNRLLNYCETYKIKKLVLLSSFDVYGARPENSQFLTEEAPLLARELSALRDVDMMAQSFFWKQPKIETVILRPTNITGGVSSALTKYLRMNLVPNLIGYDPMVQIIHEEDVIQAIKLALKPNCRGIFNIAGPPPLPISRLIRHLGRDTIPIPHPLAPLVLSQLKKLGITSAHPAHIDYIRYICMIDDTHAHTTLGYSPSKSLKDSIAAVDVWS